MRLWHASTRRNSKTPGQNPIRGVNLGGWLVLEKWMTPSIFDGTTAVDEHGYCLAADNKLLDRLEQHRQNFITETDFIWLREHGITAVRLPVGYWVFGDEPPFAGTIEYVDKAFAWAERQGIKILLDMHGAPGSQNGEDHSGVSGKVAWHKNQTNTVKTLDVLTRLAQRYAGHPALLGIELLNEPKWFVPKRALIKYYEAAFTMIRKTCGEDTWIVFGDNLLTRRWRRNAYVDTHKYQAYSRFDKKRTIGGHLAKTLGPVRRSIARMAKRHPVIVGEWSLALAPQSLEGLNDHQLQAARRAYAGAQLVAYEQAAAWFYWSYKTENGGAWSYRDCVIRGWLPEYSAQ